MKKVHQTKLKQQAKTNIKSSNKAEEKERWDKLVQLEIMANGLSSTQSPDSLDQLETNELIMKGKSMLDFAKSKEGLESLITTQLLSLQIHQQESLAKAKKTSSLESYKYYINSATKLTNAFTGLVQALTKLKCGGTQKMVIERVEVSNGGQAVVGNIQGDKEKK